jgi:type I restriction enzyme S subunit
LTIKGFLSVVWTGINAKGYPYYGASGIIDYIDDYIFDGKYLLIAEDGENLNSRKMPIAFFASGKFWVNNHAHIIKAINTIADDYFIKAWFDQANISGYITGAAQPKLSQANLRRVKILLPPLPTQRKIAAILSAYDDLIENNARRIKILEEMAQALYRHWFVDYKFPGYEDVHMVDSGMEMGLVPEGWDIVNLFDVANVTYGYGFKSSLFTTEITDYPVIRIRDIPKNSTETFTTEISDIRYLVEDGDILVGMDGDFHMCRWAGGKAFLNQRVARFQSVNNLSQYLLFLFLKTPIEYFNSTITGTTVAHLGDRHLKTIMFAIPNTELLDIANNLFHPLFQHEIVLRKKNNTLRQTRDMLLPKLVSGELDLSQLEIEIGGVVI